MKSTIHSKAIKDVYPYLGISDDGTVVLFIGPRRGVCVRESDVEDSEDFIGLYLESCWLEHKFKRMVDQKIILEND